MKMYEVLSMVAKGKVKDGDTLEIVDTIGGLYEYKYHEIYKDFRDEYANRLGNDFLLDKDFLNFDVKLTQPKKYQLKLYIGDVTSYVTRSCYDNDFNYDLGSKCEVGKFKKKFTQEEIDNDKFLKFIEQHGIKEEVEEDEND